MKKNDLISGTAAAGAVIVPQALVNAFPQLTGSILPLASRTLPYCSGSCSACGGLCVSSISAVVWLSICAVKGHLTAKSNQQSAVKDQ